MNNLFDPIYLQYYKPSHTSLHEMVWYSQCSLYWSISYHSNHGTTNYSRRYGITFKSLRGLDLDLTTIINGDPKGFTHWYVYEIKLFPSFFPVVNVTSFTPITLIKSITSCLLRNEHKRFFSSILPQLAIACIISHWLSSY